MSQIVSTSFGQPREPAQLNRQSPLIPQAQRISHQTPRLSSSLENNATTPTAQIACNPDVAEKGSRVTISYTCTNSTRSTGYGFDTNGQTSGAVTVTLAETAQAEKLFVEISQKRLAQLGLDMNQVIAQLGAQNAVEGAGVLNAGAENLQVRIGGAFNSVEELKRLPIRAVNPATGQAGTLRLADIADVRRDYVDPPSVKVRHQGKDVIALGVSMAKGGDIIALGQALQAAARELQAELPVGLELSQVQDQPQAVSRSVGEFVGVLVEAIVVVLGVSFLSLGLHLKRGFPWFRIDIWPGLVVAITIPLVLAITFVTMFYWGVGLHKISLGSLIIALGLLVDDAIIAVEMMVRKLEEGYDKVRAATFAYEVTSMPMLTGTLITAAGFLPIGLAKSVTGEYTFAIFAVTSAALLISWVVSVYFVPYLGAWLLHTKSKVGGEDRPHELFDTPFYSRFRAAVDWCVGHRWTTIALTLALFAAGLFGMGKVQQQFFPDSSRPEILVDLWLPEGVSQVRVMWAVDSGVQAVVQGSCGLRVEL